MTGRDSLFSALERLHAEGGGNAGWPLIAAALSTAKALRDRISLDDDPYWGTVALLDDFDKAFAAVLQASATTLHGPLAETPDGDIHDYSDHPDYPTGDDGATQRSPLEQAAGAFLILARDRGLGRFMPDELSLLEAMAEAIR